MLRNKLMEKMRSQVSLEEKTLMEDSFALADRIYFLLKKHRISQRQLAEKLNKRESEISKWLSGGHNFTQATLTKIGLAVGEKVYLIPKEKKDIRVSNLKSIIFRVIRQHKEPSIKYEIFNELSNLEVSSTGIICHNPNPPKLEFKRANLNPEAFSEIEKDIKL